MRISRLVASEAGPPMGEVPVSDVPVREVVVRCRPFASLVRLARERRFAVPNVLLVSPLSGHRPLLMRDMAVGLLAFADIYFIAWTDASLVPRRLGAFGLDENIEYVADFIRWMGPQTHVIALSQSPLPALAATSLLADSFGAGAEPASLTLISGFLDPRINRTRIGWLLSSLQPDLFALLALRTVSRGRPGGGRLIYPACIQAIGLEAYRRRHLATLGELWFKTFFDDGDPGGPPFLEGYLSLADLPGEVVADMVKTAFHDYLLPRGQLRWRGQRVNPQAISRCGLMTIEGAGDDVSGVGQTCVAHRLCSAVPAALRSQHLEPGIGHFGAFHGRSWREHILPRVISFINLCESTQSLGAARSTAVKAGGVPS